MGSAFRLPTPNVTRGLLPTPRLVVRYRRTGKRIAKRETTLDCRGGNCPVFYRRRTARECAEHTTGPGISAACIVEGSALQLRGRSKAHLALSGEARKEKSMDSNRGYSGGNRRPDRGGSSQCSVLPAYIHLPWL